MDDLSATHIMTFTDKRVRHPSVYKLTVVQGVPSVVSKGMDTGHLKTAPPDQCHCSYP